MLNARQKDHHGCCSVIFSAKEVLWQFKIIVSGDYSDTQVENGQFVQEHLAGEKYIVLKSLVEKLEVLGN